MNLRDNIEDFNDHMERLRNFYDGLDHGDIVDEDLTTLLRNLIEDYEDYLGKDLKELME